MNQTLSIFEHPQFGLVRSILIDGEPYFIGRDVATCLRYERPSEAVTRYCKKFLYAPLETDSTGKKNPNFSKISNTQIKNIPINQQVRLIGEPDLYRLIMRSTLPSAEKFQDWVFEDVLPTIRKKGSHGVKPAFTVPANYLDALEECVRLEKSRLALESKVVEAEEKIKELEPDAMYTIKTLKSTSTFPITNIANELNMTPQKLNLFLEEKGIQYKCNKQWVISAPYLLEGFTDTCTVLYEHNYGIGTIHQLRWTEKGRKFIHELVKKNKTQ